MPIVVDHMTVPVSDTEATLEFYAYVFAGRRGLARGRIVGLWLSENLELQFRAVDDVESNHYAFRLDRAEFDEVLGRIKSLGIPHGSSAIDPDGELKINEDSQAVFFPDPNGHGLELITSL